MKTIFEVNKAENSLMNNQTTLTACYKLNERKEIVRHFFYSNISENHSYDSKTKQWIKRIFSKAIGRIVSVSPKDVEGFHLKFILHRVKGATSSGDLKIHELFKIFSISRTNCCGIFSVQIKLTHNSCTIYTLKRLF